MYLFSSNAATEEQHGPGCLKPRTLLMQSPATRIDPYYGQAFFDKHPFGAARANRADERLVLLHERDSPF
jgi:hypothetical protein